MARALLRLSFPPADAGFGLLVEFGGCGGGAALAGELQYLDGFRAVSLLDFQHVTCPDGVRGLYPAAVAVHLATFDGLAGYGPALEKARGPEPFVYADFLC